MQENGEQGLALCDEQAVAKYSTTIVKTQK
jgi:hypothetical protein